MITPDIVLSGEFTPFEGLFLDLFDDVRSFDAGDTVLNTCDERDVYCYYVLSGAVSSEFVGLDGSKRTVAIRSAGAIFPLYYTYSETSMEKVLEFVAMNPCRLLRMEKRKLLQAMIDTPAIGVAMMDAWGKYSTYLCYLVATQGDSVRMRVCSLLHYSQDSYGLVHASHQEIAQCVGSSRETVSRIVGDLARCGVVQRGKGVLRVLDSNRLKQMSSPIAAIGSRDEKAFAC